MHPTEESRFGPSPGPFTDIAVNLTDKRFRDDVDDVCQRAREAGVHRLIITGTDLPSSLSAMDLSQRYEQCYCTGGVHPHAAQDYNAAIHTELLNFHQQDTTGKLVAVGETGLDFNRDFSPRPLQERAFEQQLEIACQTGKPVLLHQRDAHTRFEPILKQYRDQLAGAVVHCFTGSKEELFAYLDLDCHIGITGWICDERRGEALQQLVKNIPDNRLLLETDAPYLLPRDLPQKPIRKGRNEPGFLPWIAASVARYREQETQYIQQISNNNASALFQLS